MTRKQRHAPEDALACPLESTLDIIGGKWKGLILYRLDEGTKRFNELNRMLCKITPRTLTKQLRELEADGLIRRKVYPQVPPKVEYDLTERGRTLIPALEALTQWGLTHLELTLPKAPVT